MKGLSTEVDSLCVYCRTHIAPIRGLRIDACGSAYALAATGDSTLSCPKSQLLTPLYFLCIALPLRVTYDAIGRKWQ